MTVAVNRAPIPRDSALEEPLLSKTWELPATGEDVVGPEKGEGSFSSSWALTFSVGVEAWEDSPGASLSSSDVSCTSSSVVTGVDAGVDGSGIETGLVVAEESVAGGVDGVLSSEVWGPKAPALPLLSLEFGRLNVVHTGGIS